MPTKFLCFFCWFTVVFCQLNIIGPYFLDPGDLSTYDQYGNCFAFGTRNGNPYLLVGAFKNRGTGAVYGWQRISENDWQLTDKIIPPDYPLWFGYSIALVDDLLAVGAPQSNRVYIFRRNATDQWYWDTTLSEGIPSFGWSLSATVYNGNIIYLAVGAPSGRNGTVFIYEYQSGVWTLVLKYTDTSQLFASTLAFGGPQDLLVGSPQSNSTRGAVLHFTYDLNNWNYVDTIVSPDPRFNANFGGGLFGDPNSPYWMVGSPGISGAIQILSRSLGSVAIVDSIYNPDPLLANKFGAAIGYDSNSGLVVVGAHFDSSLNITDLGAVYLFNGKNLLLKLYPSNTSEYFLFGKAVAIYDQIFVVHAEGYNNLQGAVYVYEVNSSIPTSPSVTPNDNNPISTPSSSPVIPSSSTTPSIPSQSPMSLPPISNSPPSTIPTTPTTPTTPTGGLSFATHLQLMTPILVVLLILLVIFKTLE